MSFDRRDFLRTTGLAAAASAFPMNWVSARGGASKKILMFTRSQGFQHDVVNRSKPDGKKFLGEKGKLAHAEHLLTEWGKKHGFEVTCTKDGRVFVPEEIAKYDAFFFYTTGDLTEEKSADNTPAMTKEGKKYLLDAISNGKGFMGSHCATDTFHSPGDRQKNQPVSERDPYIQMIGGEFIVHGEQFKAKMKVCSSSFPSVADREEVISHHHRSGRLRLPLLPLRLRSRSSDAVTQWQTRQTLSDFDLREEWYSLKNFSSDLHVILAQDSSEANAMWKADTKNPKRVEGGNAFHIRPLHPATWARMHGKGRVFYTSMGHREDVWTNETFQKVLLGGVAWALGNVDADIPANISKVTPQAEVLRS